MTRYALLLMLLLPGGCLSSAARQSITPLAPTTQAAQQSGQGNVAAQLDAPGWTGMEYTTAVPVGQVALMTLMLWFSHRREVLRIRQNGRHA